MANKQGELVFLKPVAILSYDEYCMTVPVDIMGTFMSLYVYSNLTLIHSSAEIAVTSAEVETALFHANRYLSSNELARLFVDECMESMLERMTFESKEQLQEILKLVVAIITKDIKIQVDRGGWHLSSLGPTRIIL